MVIFENKHIIITYNENDKSLEQKWIDFVPSEIFRMAIDETVTFTAKHPVESILSDALQQKVVSMTDASYAASVLPELFGNGLKAMAFVIPKDIFTQLSLKNFAQAQHIGQVRYFTSREEAETWIEELITHTP